MTETEGNDYSDVLEYIEWLEELGVRQS